METNYSQWKPTLLGVIRRLSILILFSSSAGRHFSLYDDHSISSLFPTFIDALALGLLPLHFTASVKPTTPLSLLPFTTKQTSKSSSIFSLFSDRNFLDMDEKFATSLGWTSRPCGSSVPQFQPFTSLPLLATTSPILDTTRSPNPPLLSPKSGIAVLVHLFV